MMKVTAVDVYGDRLKVDHVITVVRLGGSTRHRKIANVPAGGRGSFEVDVTHTYHVRVVADGYGKAAVSALGTEDDVTVIVPVSSSEVTGYSWPDPPPEIPGIDFGTLLEEGGGPNGEHDGRGGKRTATLLNIWAKLWATSLGLTPAATFVQEVLEVRDDRIIARVSHELLEALELAESVGTLELADSSLHEPPDGYGNGPSFKTLEERAGLQVSLFIADDLEGSLLADIDIDEARGIAHAFDVIGHHVTGRTTDPIEIHELLVHGGIDPGWKPLVA